MNWLLARQNGWRISLRIEDLDGPRVKRGAAAASLDDLRWLELDWDEDPIYQSARTELYQSAIDQLLERGLAYPCVCSRRDVEIAASAPHATDRQMIYPGTCRERFSSVKEARRLTGKEPAVRFRVSDEVITFTDKFAGPQSFDAMRDIGDFVIQKADRTPAYQLAVTVDDLATDITQVIRGDDLLESTAKQLLLMKALAPDRTPPRYTHLPLIVGPDGLRLAKRHGDSRISYYRSIGVSSGQVHALLSRWCGMKDDSTQTTLISMLARFDMNLIPHQPIVFTQAEEAKLVGCRSRT